MSVSNIQFEFAAIFNYQSPLNTIGDCNPDFYTDKIDFQLLCDTVVENKGKIFDFDYTQYKSKNSIRGLRYSYPADNPLTVKNERNQEVELKLSAKLNKKKGKVIGGKLFNIIDIDGNRKVFSIQTILHYENAPNETTNLCDRAIIFNCDDITTHDLLNRYLGGNTKEQVSNAFIKAIGNARDEAALNFLYKKASGYAMKKRGDEDLWNDFIKLLKYDEGSSKRDASSAVLNMLSAGFSNVEWVYKKLYANPALVLRTYKEMDNGNTLPFCQLITALSLIFTTEDQFKSLPRLYERGDYALLNDRTTLIYGPFKASAEVLRLTQEDRTQWVYFYNMSGNSQPYVPKEEKERLEKLMPVRQVRLHPMDLLALFDDKEKSEEYISAIGLEKVMNDKHRAQMWEVIMGALTIISFLTSVGAIIRGAAFLVRTMAYIDIATTAITELLKIKEIRKLLEKSDEGRWFLKNWDTINLFANLGVMAPVLAEGIIKNGPKILESLRGAGKNLSEKGKQLMGEIENLLKKAQESKSAVAKGTSLNKKIADFLSEWVGKRVSGRGFLNSSKLSRTELKAWKVFLLDTFATEIKFVEKNSKMKKLLDVTQREACFIAEENTIWIKKSSATHFIVSHEMYHAEECYKLGKGTYLKGASELGGSPADDLIRTFKREKYVYDRIIENIANFSEAEITYSKNYINQIVKKLEKSEIDISKII